MNERAWLHTVRSAWLIGQQQLDTAESTCMYYIYRASRTVTAREPRSSNHNQHVATMQRYALLQVFGKKHGCSKRLIFHAKLR